MKIYFAVSSFAAGLDGELPRDEMGLLMRRLDKDPELRRAFALQKDPEIAAHVGEVLWVLDRKEEARKYFDEARRLDPDNRALKRALQKIGE